MAQILRIILRFFPQRNQRGAEPERCPTDFEERFPTSNEKMDSHVYEFCHILIFLIFRRTADKKWRRRRPYTSMIVYISRKVSEIHEFEISEKKTPPPLILGTYCPDRSVQGTLNSQIKQTFGSAFTLRVVQERDKSWWILFSYVIGNYFLSVVCSVTCYSGYFCNEFTKLQHCFRTKIMPKRDKNTSALGIATRMPSFNVIWFKS